MFAPVEVLSVHVVLFEPAESGLAFEAGDDGTNVDAEAFGYEARGDSFCGLYIGLTRRLDNLFLPVRKL